MTKKINSATKSVRSSEKYGRTTNQWQVHSHVQH